MRRPGTTVITLMWGTAWERYGKNFAETFDRFWPKDVDLIVVSDRPLPLPRGRCVPLSAARGYTTFTATHPLPLHHGLDRPKGGKVDSNGYSWRHDAVKWAPQGFAPELAAAELLDGELVVWLDADVITFRDVPEGFVDRLLGRASLCHLGRKPKHSEIGFWATRLDNKTRGFLAAFADLYRHDTIFNLKEWHSAYAFDQCAIGLGNLGAKIFDLTPGGTGNVWAMSPLAAYTDHLKGKRKDRVQA